MIKIFNTVITFNWFDKEFTLIGLQFMNYESFDLITNETEEGKSLALGFMILTITIHF